MGTTVNRTAAQQRRINEITEQLTGDEGKRRANIVCKRYGRHLDVDELINEAVIAVIDAVDRGVEIIKPMGYAYGVMRNVMLNVIGAREIPIDPTTHEERSNNVLEEAADPTAGGEFEHIDQTDVDRRFDEIRIGLETSGAPTDVISAALAKLVLGDAEAINLDGLPQPIAGAAPDDAQWWPCAFIATLDQAMFPADGRAGASHRQRRSRFIRAAKSLLDRIRIAPMPLMEDR